MNQEQQEPSKESLGEAEPRSGAYHTRFTCEMWGRLPNPGRGPPVFLMSPGGVSRYCSAGCLRDGVRHGAWWQRKRHSARCRRGWGRARQDADPVCR
jgi:hypothetical protein